MVTSQLQRKVAFVVPNLGAAAAQNEDVVQLLLFASARLEQEREARPARITSATIISVEPDESGWQQLATLFSKETLQRVTVLELPEPATPNLAIASHKPAYHLFEFLKSQTFHEVHCLDRCGLAYYPTQAKRLGLNFLDTVFAVHVMGGIMFRKEVEDSLLDEVGALMDDLLERGSLERADVIYIHDRKAWNWYANKIEKRNDIRICDLAWAKEKSSATKPTPLDAENARALVYYGPLGAEGGLPLFCDGVGLALPKIDQPVEVFFVGAPRPIGGMDAVSYIRLRSAKWGVPVTIKRELSIADEIAFIADLNGIVVCNSIRRESLRSRLIVNSGPQVLQIQPEEQNGKIRVPIPARIAQTLVEMLAAEITTRPLQTPALVELWSTGRPSLTNLEDIPSSLPFQILDHNLPKVSVCVTHFSRPQKLRTALASLKQQTYENFEVIVVDDGSPDPEVKDELEKIGQEIAPLGWRIVFQENRYLGAARNFGASHATGDYLLFMDDDIIISRTMDKPRMARGSHWNASSHRYSICRARMYVYPA